MNIDLKINFLPFDLGEPVESKKFRDAGLAKVGVLQKALMLAAPWAPIFWANSCSVASFWKSGKQFSLIADHGGIGSCSPAAYLYCWKGRIQIVKLAMLASADMHEIFARNFIEAAQSALGAPTGRIKQSAVWQEENQRLVAGYPRFFVDWSQKPWH
jgi:hypothetical protein